MLVLYHAFAPWCGGWRPFDGFQENSNYWWIGKFAYSFMLPTFVFISSYVFSYQRETLGKIDSFSTLLQKKAQRLLIPSLVFSVLYIPLLPRFGGGNLFVHYLNNVLKGAGHMWFLPMLFWCFLLLYILLKVKSVWFRFAISLVFMIGPVLQLPLQMGTALSYLFYFLWGYELYKNKNLLIERLKTVPVILMWFLFVVVFIGLTVLKRDYLSAIGDDSFAFRLIRMIANNTSTLAYTSLGIIAMLITAIRVTDRNQLPSWIVKVGSYCFGVYIFQQFILQILYYHTSLPLYLGNEFLPWIGFVGALVLSLILSYILRLTRIGRNLI